jgi:tetratricopeptide (TPR) repeat protein
MMAHMTPRFRSTHISEIPEVSAVGGTLRWKPVRRTLGIEAFGINAYTADEDGQLVEEHDERGGGAGGHEELYVVLTGGARFVVDGEEVDASAGTLVFVPPGVRREAVARDAGTTVLVVGGRPGDALPVSPFEYWYAAIPAYESGDYRRAVEIASEGLGDWPDHPTLRYQLACYEALAGEADRALEHLRIAFGRDPRLREWAEEDSDLDAIRGRPDYPA